MENRRHEALLTADALQRAIFNSANFSSIATDAKGVIQIFNVGAARMPGYAAGLILMAEDNRVNQQVILHQRRVLGRVADVADDGRASLVRWQGGEYAVVITDLNMPAMNATT